MFGDFSAQRLGRSGQAQGGIDITATNRRGAGEAIVIQCKFKSKPDTVEFSKLKKDLTDDYTAALKHHHFDEFVFATTCQRDAKLRNVADALVQQYTKPIVLWFWDDLQDKVNVHPRLQRLFAEGGDATGVTLIDHEFVNRIASIPVNSFQFYCGMSYDNLQWAGVAQNHDAPRIVLPTIQTRVDELFALPLTEARVAAVVHGEGGSGKSTLLRRIAIERARAGSCVCWWVESIATFMEFDRRSVDENPHQQHLVFIDDWYRNVREDTGNFFRWLKSSVAKNVRVLIGDRPGAGRAYGEYLYGGVDAMHPLLPAENRMILNHVVDTLRVSVPDSASIDVTDYAFNQAPLFVSLFVLSYEAQASGASAAVNFSDGVTVRFQKIITNQLLELERDHRFCGYGRALAFLGRIYAMEGTRWQVFSEDTMVAMAEFFAKPSNQSAPVASLERYPRALSALIHQKVTARSVTGCQFNHDVIAERGLAAAPAHAWQLHVDAINDAHEARALVDCLIDRRDASGALLVWDWLARSGLLADDDSLVRLLMTTLRLCADTQFYVPLEAVLAALPSATLKQQVTDSLLSDTNLLVRLGPRIGPLLTANRGHPGVKAAAHAVLSTENFAKVLPHQIVSRALNILGNGKAGLNAALAILGTDNFAKVLPAEIVSHALKIVGAEEAGLKAAGAILQTEDFATVLPHAIVSNALITLGNKSEGFTAARAILTTKDFATVLPHAIVNNALIILGNKGEGLAAARAILTTKDFATVLPHAIVSHALKILASDVAGRAAAESVLCVPEKLLELPKEIISVALRVAEESNVRSTAAVYLLKHADRTDPKLQFAAVRALAPAQDVSSRETLRAYVVELMNDASPTAALFRLRDDLLFLPLSWVSAHARLLRWVARRYRPECATKIRQNVFKILRCRLQFGPQPEVDREVIELCHRVVCECIADLDHQWRVDSRDLKFGHIWTAAQILDDPSTTADVLARLNDYAVQHVDIAQTEEFRNLLSIMEGRWEAESHATDDFEAV